MNARTGLYDPAFEHDACGVAFVARLDATPLARDGRAGARRRSRTSSTVARPAPTRDTGDGAGILLQLPDAFFRAVLGDGLPRGRALRRRDVLPAARRGAPRRSSSSCSPTRSSTRRARRVVGWRDVPVDAAHAGRHGRADRARRSPALRRGRAPALDDQDAFERKLYVIRRRVRARRPAPTSSSRASRRGRSSTRACSPRRSCRGYFPDLRDERIASALALVHSRFSTNTFPSWELAHPYRMIAHNGEINTLRGNVNWMRARESQLASELFGDDLAEGAAGRPPGRLRHGDLRQRARAARARPGRSLPHAMMMMIPEAYAGPRRPARRAARASTPTTSA